jgi:hypothetical protein
MVFKFKAKNAFYKQSTNYLKKGMLSERMTYQNRGAAEVFNILGKF